MIIGTFRDTAFSAPSSSKTPARRLDTPSEASTDDDEIVEVSPPRTSEYAGWAYVGSHNFTPSAWGTLSGTSFNPVLNVRARRAVMVRFRALTGREQITNFELGVLIPLRNEAELERVACWERPPRKYVLGKDEPWVCISFSASEAPADSCVDAIRVPFLHARMTLHFHNLLQSWSLPV